MARFEKGTGKLRFRRKGGKPIGNLGFKYEGRWISTETKNRADAEEYRRRFLGEVGRGADPSRSRHVRVNQLFDLVAGEYERRVQDAHDAEKRSKRESQQRLESRLNRHLRPFFGRLRADAVKKSTVTRYRTKRQAEGAAVKTINLELETLRRAFNLGKEDEIVWRSPKVRLAEVDNARQGFLEPEDYELLLDSFDDEAVRLLFIIGYHIGWRAGRITTLKWDQIDLKQLVIVPPPHQAANKWVGPAPIYGDLERALREAQMITERDFPDCRWVVHRAGKRVKVYRYGWERAIKAAGFPNLRFHDLRRSAVRNLIDAGVDEARAMRIVGHKTRAMLDRYRIVSMKDVKAAGEKVGRYLDAKRRQAKPRTVQ